jgi:hypothetical protein
MRSARHAADAAAARNIANHINGLLLSPASAYDRGPARRAFRAAQACLSGKI